MAIELKQRDRIVVIALALAMAALAIYAWRQHAADERAEREVALNTTRMLREVFVAKGDLRVGQLQGVVLASTVNDGLVFRTTQETRAPATVNYMLDMRAAAPGDFAWDADRRSMTIRVPDVTVEPPAVDMAQAEVRQGGIWIGRSAGQALQRQAAQRIATRATERARTDANLAKARTAARTSVVRFVKGPLAAVGYDDVDVRVVFPWEAGRNTEQWDRSRNLDQVRANQF